MAVIIRSKEAGVIVDKFVRIGLLFIEHLKSFFLQMVLSLSYISQPIKKVQICQKRTHIKQIKIIKTQIFEQIRKKKKLNKSYRIVTCWCFQLCQHR